MFGKWLRGRDDLRPDVTTTIDWTAELAETPAPTDRDCEVIDVREMGPPDPMVETLETLPELAGDVLLVQVNDRAPQHLYPKLDDRGYEYASVEAEDAVVTGIWEA